MRWMESGVAAMRATLVGAAGADQLPTWARFPKVGTTYCLDCAGRVRSPTRGVTAGRAFCKACSHSFSHDSWSVLVTHCLPLS